ncbi:MAG TPA: Fe-S cluster assembly protein SufD, partial [Kofleriaceae bacterium]|nr:Fe-S cluster assembly protein SufD [Kofleriaceae bacterium]
IETYTTGGGDGLVVPVTEVAVGDDASLEHVRVTLGQESGFHVAALAATQGRQSRYLSRVITRGGPLSRVDVRATLAGEGGECELLGFYHATGHDHVDHPTLIEHAAPYATSREIYRGIADGRGSAVFDGTIVVRPGAIKTNAHQENRNLVLSDDASVNTKPHLEIDTDDVVCSHGATIGALDPEALSYLRIRGIGESQARAMLTAAFVRQILDGVSGAAIRRRLAAELAPKLALGEGESGLFASFDEDWDAISR